MSPLEEPLSKREEAWIREFALNNSLDPGSLLEQRKKGVPLAYILGTQPFHEIELKVSPAVLVPRPETEELVERLLAVLPPSGSGLDLGCGSGALCLALAHALPGWTFDATDISGEALAVAKENAAALGLGERVSFYQGDWWGAPPSGGLYDLVVTNPPYVGTGEEIDLGASHEPALALFAGPDGLDAYRAILPGAKASLKKGGIFAGECGPYHSGALLKLAEEAGFAGAGILEDRSGRPRFLWFENL